MMCLLKQAILPIKCKYKIPTKQYLDQGKYPVIDQGQEFIGGYTNDEAGVISQLPVIVFGDHTRVFKYVDFPFVGGADGVKIFQAKSCLLPKLLFYFLQAVTLPDRGYARHYQYLVKSMIPVPPLAEQKRIVRKIEELFGVIDRDIQRLTDTLEQLSQFRQSVLQQAFSGKLYKTTNWLITTFGKSFISINPKIKIKTKNYLSNGDIPIIDQGEDFISGYWNNKNDAIQISKPVLCFGDHTRRFKYVDFNFVVGADGLKIFQPKDFEPKFGYYAALALKFPNKGYARHSVFLKKCKMYIPSLPEQQKIVDEIEKAFHAADQVQKAVQNALEEAKKLKQSILKKAFAGELVPQDPNDKPVNLPVLKGKTK